MSTNAKLKNKVVKNGQNAKSLLSPFEAAVQFSTFINFKVGGREVGAYLCRKKESSYKITFAFDCKGIAPVLPDATLSDVFAKLEGGFKDLPDGEELTFHLESFADDFDRQIELSGLSTKVKGNSDPRQVDSQVLRGLIYSKKERTQYLRDNGLRKPKKLTLYGTYTYEASEGERDALEKTINAVLKLFRQNVTGEYDSQKYNELNNYLESAYKDGLKQWELALGNKMGLTIRPLKVEEIWGNLWKRFNRTAPINVPQYLVFNGINTTEVVNSEVSTLSLLLNNEDSVPVSARNFVHCNGKYQAVMLLADKPDGWSDESAQLRYIWKLLSDREITDTEVICQVVKGNQKALQEKLSTLTEQSIGKAADAAKNGTVNVGANKNAQRAVEAQELLFDGCVPLRMACTFIIHREKLQDLDDACRSLASKVYRPAWLTREIDYIWHPWIQSFPGLVWDKLYAAPWDRRFNCLSSEIAGFIPVTKTTSPHDRGFELIAAEGNAPILIDIYSQVLHVGVFATTRAGKSVLVSDILTDALSHGMPVSILDFPREDGTGTFSEYVPLLGGAYFNIANECLNLFELPKLKGFDRETQEQRQSDFQDSLLEILATIVLTDKLEGKDNVQEVRSILLLAMNAFFKDIQIQRRYSLANSEGLGTDAWSKMPTLIDYIGYCTIGRLKMTSPTEKLLEAIEYINLQLDAFVSSKIGRSLSSPSTFKSDSQLFAIALANLANQQDALIVAMATNLVILRRSLGYSRSIIFIDEAPILFSFEAIAEQIGKFFANGAKSGIGLIISAQEPKSIAQAKCAAKVFDNLAIVLVGRIRASAIDNFVNILKIPLETISRCATEDFYPKMQDRYSQWVMFDGISYTVCQYYPSNLQLAAVANNKPETEIRLRHMSQNSNPVRALIATADELLGLPSKETNNSQTNLSLDASLDAICDELLTSTTPRARDSPSR